MSEEAHVAGRKGNTFRTCYVCHQKENKCSCRRDPTILVARDLDEAMHTNSDLGLGINKHKRWEGVEVITSDFPQTKISGTNDRWTILHQEILQTD